MFRKPDGTINYDCIRQWLRLCDGGAHEKCRRRDVQKVMVMPEWLIDVKLNSLTRAKGRYAALSYVWGKLKFLQTKNVSLQSFTKPGAFSQDDWHSE